MPAKTHTSTDFGDLPSDWKVGSIDDSRPFITSGSRGWARYYSGYGAPFIRIGNLSHNWVDVSLDDLQCVQLDPAASVEATRTCLRRDDLLISITADIGAIGFVHEHVPLPAYINQHIALVRFDPAVVHSKFAAYVLASRAVQRLFMASMDIGAKAGMSLVTVRKIRMPLPPVSEQKAIAAALSDVDGLIASLDRLIAKKRAIKQAAMQQLLTGKTRLPGFRESWRFVKLRDLAKSESGGTPPTGVARFYGGSIPWASIADMTGIGKYLTATERTLTLAGLAACTAQVWPAGTILYAMYASIGECCIASTEMASSQAILGLRPTEGVCGEYLYYTLAQRKDAVKALAQHGTQPNLNAEIVRGFEIALPGKREQLAIVEAIRDIDNSIAVACARLEKAKRIKQGMMQALLTGRVRLPSGLRAVGGDQ